MLPNCQCLKNAGYSKKTIKIATQRSMHTSTLLYGGHQPKMSSEKSIILLLSCQEDGDLEYSLYLAHFEVTQTLKV